MPVRTAREESADIATGPSLCKNCFGEDEIDRARDLEGLFVSGDHVDSYSIAFDKTGIVGGNRI
jgi:hypothetical protein